MVQITVQHRSSSKSSGKPAKPPVVIDFPHRHPNKVSVLELKGAIEAKFPRLLVSRQRITLDNVPFTDDDKTLDDYHVKEGDSLFLKDLGRQISWKTVFLVEYAGPLIIHPLFYFYGQQIYGGLAKIAGETLVPFEHSDVQKVALGLVLLHFVKRELETLFVHRFSNATMPFFNLFKNSAHYHLLSGLLLSFGIYGPWNSAPKLAGSIRSSPLWLGGWTAFILFSIASNLHTHLTLRALRPEGTKKRSIPNGYGFNQVFCANYFFESLEWIAFTVMTGSLSAGVFTVAAVGQMAIWALKKKKNYKKEFGKEVPRGRKAIFPYLL
ncbi:3-oxo-5-alpha-steroid 4-dehydrogenase-domain-containing protein [Mrakia frigida]|uniref:trans-2-enoyl-CoA reductase (NADPH) TSC13 n=1 Tax=Mrakia frigida TaxID=29902 RepID=UPI003FCC1E8B